MKMTAGAGGGKGRMQKAAMAAKKKSPMKGYPCGGKVRKGYRGGGKVSKSGYMCGGKVHAKRGYGAARGGSS